MSRGGFLISIKSQIILVIKVKLLQSLFPHKLGVQSLTESKPSLLLLFLLSLSRALLLLFNKICWTKAFVQSSVEGIDTLLNLDGLTLWTVLNLCRLEGIESCSVFHRQRIVEVKTLVRLILHRVRIARGT